MNSTIKNIHNLAKANLKTIILPEPQDERIQAAAKNCHKRKNCQYNFY
jgi:phosphotransacetylase